MKADTHTNFNNIFADGPSIRQQLHEIQCHQISADFADRWSQNLRFITALDLGDGSYDTASQSRSSEAASELGSESGSEDLETTSSQASHESELLPLPPGAVLPEESVCLCRGIRHFSAAGSSKLRITSKDPPELPNCTHYVAISYCWTRQKESTPRYSVQTQKDVRSNLAHSDVIDRAVAFAIYYRVRLIWIDQECIVQDDRKDKEQGIQSMDLVYQQACHAVALLTVRITLEAHAIAFYKSLCGEDLEPQEYKDAVEILEKIAADRRLSRAWCYQESAAAGETMRLLIPCDVALDEDYEFTAISGEFDLSIFQLKCAVAWVNATADNYPHVMPHDPKNLYDDLTGRVEKLASSLIDICPTAYQQGPRSPRFRYGCNASEALPLLGDRQCTRVEDKLAILANICNFPTRLNTHDLQESEKGLRREHSFSACFALLAIMNGDMSLLASAKQCDETVGRVNESFIEAGSVQYIPAWMPFTKMALKDIPSEIELHPHIFRFTQPRLSSAGLALSGHLWSIEQRADLRVLQQCFKSQWLQSESQRPDSDDLVKEMFGAILLQLLTDGLYPVAECLWNFARPSTYSDAARKRADDDLGEISLNNLPLLETDWQGRFNGKAREANIELRQVLLSNEEIDSKLLCGPQVHATANCVWIIQKIIEDGFLWYGSIESPVDSAQPMDPSVSSSPTAVFDCASAVSILTPHSNLLEGQPRSLLSGKPISWIVHRASRYCEHGEIVHGTDLVKGIFKSDGEDPKCYVLD